MHIRDYHNAGSLIGRYKEMRGLQEFLRQFPGSEVHIKPFRGDGIGVPAQSVIDVVDKLVQSAKADLQAIGVEV